MALNPRQKRNRRVQPKNTVGGQIRGLLAIVPSEVTPGDSLVRFNVLAIAANGSKTDWTPPQLFKAILPPIWIGNEFGGIEQQAFEVISAIDGVRLEAKFVNPISNNKKVLVIGQNMRVDNAMIGVQWIPFTPTV